MRPTPAQHRCEPQLRRLPWDALGCHVSRAAGLGFPSYRLALGIGHAAGILLGSSASLPLAEGTYRAPPSGRRSPLPPSLVAAWRPLPPRHVLATRGGSHPAIPHQLWRAGQPIRLISSGHMGEPIDLSKARKALLPKPTRRGGCAPPMRLHVCQRGAAKSGRRAPIGAEQTKATQHAGFRW